MYKKEVTLSGYIHKKSESGVYQVKMLGNWILQKVETVVLVTQFWAAKLLYKKERQLKTL